MFLGYCTVGFTGFALRVSDGCVDDLARLLYGGLCVS